MPNIVISYRRDDSKWIADRVFDRFESHYGKGNVFMDIDSIPFGLDFRDHIRETLERCDVMVALVGPNWVGRDETGEHILNETDWVRIEIEAALNKKIPLIPLLIDGARMPKPDELPDPLKNFVFRQSGAIDRDNFRAQMDKIIASIDHHLSKLKEADTIVAEQSQPLSLKTIPSPQPPIEIPQVLLQKARAGQTEKNDATPSDRHNKNDLFFTAMIFTLLILGIFIAVYLGLRTHQGGGF
jgi:hypothetical protein